MEDLSSIKQTSWVKLALISILAMAVASISIIGFGNIDYENVSLKPDSPYVYSVLQPIQTILDDVKQQTGGIPEKSIGVLGNILVPDWDIQSPLDNFRKTQGYWFAHKAIDITTDTGKHKIKAISNGIILYVGWSGAYGWRIEIDHRNGFISTYSHLQKYNVGLGFEVFAGDTIGIMGASGGDYGKHLHFEIIYKGFKINPEQYLKIN